MNYNQKLFQCIGRGDPRIKDYKRNNILLVTPVAPYTINQFILNWFEDYKDTNPNKYKEGQTLASILLTSESPQVKKFLKDVYSLGLACFYVERFGLPKSMGYNWYKKSLFNLIESSRFNLATGNLQFYYDVLSHYCDSQKPFGRRVIQSTARKLSHDQFRMSRLELFRVIEEQGVIIRVASNEFRFSSENMKFEISSSKKSDFLQSHSLAEVNLRELFKELT